MSINTYWLTPPFSNSSCSPFQVNGWFRRSVRSRSLSARDSPNTKFIWLQNCCEWQFLENIDYSRLRDCIWLQHDHLPAFTRISTQKWTAYRREKRGLNLTQNRQTEKIDRRLIQSASGHPFIRNLLSCTDGSLVYHKDVRGCVVNRCWFFVVLGSQGARTDELSGEVLVTAGV